ncbi:MAG: phosphoribosylformylglycinamidine cyclo-ligase [Burkholderia sp.]|nr:phosphoribosylformylglycinamidine cyclo-ligase [Burkholderia sp.]
MNLLKYSQYNHGLSYHAAGVDIDSGNTLVNKIKPFAKKTLRDGVLRGIGGFGALFEVPKKYKEPILVSGTDGVGTKLKFAFHLNRHDTIGQDLVAMSVNDILSQGAEPLFFLDYFACGNLNIDTAVSVIKGIVHGCELAGCALIGGETAEMPGMYPEGEYDLAGFAVGAVEKSMIIDGSSITEGDIVLGIASNGIHSNGFSLVHKIIELKNLDLSMDFYGYSLADALIAPTRIYVKPLLALIQKIAVKGIAHITGGGLVENIPRALNNKFTAEIYKNSWSIPPLFQLFQHHGRISDSEMYRVFNCGIGMVIIVSDTDADTAVYELTSASEQVWKIGMIRSSREGESKMVLV